MEIISNSEKETIELGKKIASKLQKGMVVVLTGDLGSGKTKLTEGILTYFGLENEISSPTFTIVNEYYADSLNIYHFDVYRIEDEDDLYSIGFYDYLRKGICVCEWSENIPFAIPKDAYKVTIERTENDVNERKITLERDNI